MGAVLATAGKREQGKGNRNWKILLEYMSANPNKPLHIGQARNICIGDTLRRTYQHA
ncbi:arginine--tRNA ligase [Patescibacteria group bacterium]|nr:arginine--tRNA ligase [Patescibacteria group bacterium]